MSFCRFSFFHSQVFCPYRTTFWKLLSNNFLAQTQQMQSLTFAYLHACFAKKHNSLYQMDSRKNKSEKKEISRGSWRAEEDEKLAEVIQLYGPKKWTVIAAKAGLKRCGKSCRLRWLNYLRPNIKRGHISDQEEDLILRLHKLLGNRWSLIAGRLPGRTDNEIKNYWNSYLSKKKKKQSDHYLTRDGSKLDQKRKAEETINKDIREEDVHTIDGARVECSKVKFDVDDFFDFSDENPSNLDWVNKYLEDAGCGFM